MKHFLILNGFEFFMTDGIKQDDNVDSVLRRMNDKNLRVIMREADAVRTNLRKVLKGNPVLTKLLSKILLSATSKVSSNTG